MLQVSFEAHSDQGNKLFVIC